MGLFLEDGTKGVIMSFKRADQIQQKKCQVHMTDRPEFLSHRRHQRRLELSRPRLVQTGAYIKRGKHNSQRNRCSEYALKRSITLPGITSRAAIL